MALEFTTMSKQGKWGFVGVICVALVVVFYIYVWQPRADEAEVLQTEIGEMQLENQRTRQVAALLIDLEAEVGQMEARLATLANILPEEQQTDELLRRLQAAASESNLELRRTSYPAHVLHDFYAEMPMELDLVGTFHDLARFFDRISKFGRVVTVGEVAIQALTEDATGTIQAQCTASTFFFLPETEVSTPEGEPGDAQVGGRP